MLISERIFEILKEKGISQKEFSERTKIPQSTISDWKGKRVNPASDKILIICEVLGVHPYDILSGTEGKQYTKPEYVYVNQEAEEYTLIEKYRQLSVNNRKRVLGYVDALSDVSRKK